MRGAQARFYAQGMKRASLLLLLALGAVLSACGVPTAPHAVAQTERVSAAAPAAPVALPAATALRSGTFRVGKACSVVFTQRPSELNINHVCADPAAGITYRLVLGFDAQGKAVYGFGGEGGLFQGPAHAKLGENWSGVAAGYEVSDGTEGWTLFVR